MSKSSESIAYQLKDKTTTEMPDLYVFATDSDECVVGTPVKIRNKLARKFYETHDTKKHFKFVEELIREYPVKPGLGWNCTALDLIPTPGQSVGDVLEQCDIVGYARNDAPVLH